jgi:hypothetical protein
MNRRFQKMEVVRSFFTGTMVMGMKADSGLCNGKNGDRNQEMKWFTVMQGMFSCAIHRGGHGSRLPTEWDGICFDGDRCS